jgi:hypothetical protein
MMMRMKERTKMMIWRLLILTIHQKEEMLHQIITLMKYQAHQQREIPNNSLMNFQAGELIKA